MKILPRIILFLVVVSIFSSCNFEGRDANFYPILVINEEGEATDPELQKNLNSNFQFPEGIVPLVAKVDSIAPEDMGVFASNFYDKQHWNDLK